MPALPNVPSVLRCRLHWTDVADVNVWSTIYLQYSGSAPSSSDASNIAVAVANAFGAEVASWGDGVVLTNVEVTDLSSSSAAQGDAACSFQGTNSSGRLAGGTCVVVGYQIDRRYRGGKPRNYFPWASINDLQNPQSWTAASLASWTSAVGTIFSTILGTTVGGTTLANHVNVSYYEGFTVEGGTGGKRARNVPTLRTTPLVDTVVGRTVLATPGSQRRRNR